MSFAAALNAHNNTTPTNKGSQQWMRAAVSQTLGMSELDGETRQESHSTTTESGGRVRSIRAEKVCKRKATMANGLGPMVEK